MMEKEKEWYVYMIRCKDDSLYTGITTDLERRFEEHKKGKGAKYTKVKGIEKYEFTFPLKNRSEASKMEYKIKKLSKEQKEKIIVDKNYFISTFSLNLQDFIIKSE